MAPPKSPGHGHRFGPKPKKLPIPLRPKKSGGGILKKRKKG